MEERKISVWVCREEKVILGLSRRTTCGDVVKVLLEDRDAERGRPAAALSGRAQSYCIVEKWRGFERVLPNNTKILRLWVAWGEERGSVRFVLVKTEASLNHGARSAEARVVLSTQRPCASTGAVWSPVGGISPEKQRRIVRKAFRKLEKINKKRARAAHGDASSAEKMETLVHLVISQDHTIRQQSQRISELDAQIEECEARVHFDRIKRHGVNYVQDTYLLDAAATRASHEGGGLSSAETPAELEELVRLCEELLRLQEQLRHQDALLDVFTAQMQQELNRRWMQRRREEPGEDAARVAPSSEAGAPPELELLWEEDRVRTQLDASSYVGLRISADLEATRSDLERSQETLRARERELEGLLERENAVEVEEEEEEEEEEERRASNEGSRTGGMSCLVREVEWVEQVRGPSASLSVNDDDSDTGLSSLHSQDSDPAWESRV